MGGRRSPLLYPLSLLYGLVTWVRNFLYDSEILPSKEFKKPVICIGNITAGGTGKTPLVMYMAGLLKRKYKVAILSRGYKRRTKGFLVAANDSKASIIGDEPYLIFRKFPDIVTAVDNDRVAGVNAVLNDFPETEVILLDDGFQHRRIKPGLSIVLSDYNRPVTKDHLLPYGNLRESKTNLTRADVILITKSPTDISPMTRRMILKDFNAAPYQSVLFTAVSYGTPLHVFGDNKSGKLVLEKLTPAESGAVLITGIAAPGPLRDFLEKYFGEITHLSFPDHHSFSDNDIKMTVAAMNNLKSPARFAITTEKDAVRLMEFQDIPEPLKEVLFYVPAAVMFLNDSAPVFDKLILDYVRKNRGNNRIS